MLAFTKDMLYFKEKRAAVLITTLWILVILTALSVSVANRTGVALKISSYQADKVKAYFLAKAGIYHCLALKYGEYINKRSVEIDAISEPWANSSELFKEHHFADGTYTLSYQLPEGERRFSIKEKPNLFYGLCDEASRININKASLQTLANIIERCGIEDEDEAIEIAYCIIDWRDEDSVISEDPDKGTLLGAEDDYYLDLDNPYPCKNKDFEACEELLLVKGIDHDLFYGKTDEKTGSYSYGLKDFITIYTDGEININTAPEPVLSAIFEPDYPYLGSRIAEYRKGADGALGTRDDRWFVVGSYVIDRESEGLVEVKNLMDQDWMGNIYGISNRDYSKIRQLTQTSEMGIVAKSNVYRANAIGEVKKVISKIEAVYEFKEDEAPVVRYWYQD